MALSARQQGENVVISVPEAQKLVELKAVRPGGEAGSPGQLPGKSADSAAGGRLRIHLRQQMQYIRDSGTGHIGKGIYRIFKRE